MMQSDFDHHAGDATHATAARVAETRAVKNDQAAPALAAEFFARCQH